MDITIKFIVHDCLSCKALFAIPEDVNNRYIENHNTFCCPYCVTDHCFPAKSDKEKLEIKLRAVKKSEEHYRNCCIKARNETRAYKGVATKLKKKLDKPEGS